MFLGEYAHTLDAKGRVTIPARFREELDGGFVLTRGEDPCLVAYPLDRFQERAAGLAQVSKANKDVRTYARTLFGSAQLVTLDSMGRVLIPPFLREYASLDGEVSIVGVNDVFELWNPDIFRQTIEMADMDSIRNAIAELGF